MKVHLEISAEKLLTLPNSTVRSPQQLIEFLGKLLEAGHLIWPDELKDWYITEFNQDDEKAAEDLIKGLAFGQTTPTGITKRKNDTPTHLCPYCQFAWATCICKTGQG